MEDLNVDKKTFANASLAYASISVAISMGCDILPILMTLDSRFIQILTFDLVNKFDQEQNKTPIHKSGNINVAAIQKMADKV